MSNYYIAALLTCHNRRDKTLACLESLFQQVLPEGFRLEVFLTDDGSSDDTSAAVCEQFPAVHILAGDGSLFWNGGMRLAFQKAIDSGHDFYLWLNDDTILAPGALTALLNTHSEVLTATGQEAIIAGTTRSLNNENPTYGGLVRHSRLRRTRFSLVVPESVPVESETMNGNCVLIPKGIPAKVGNLDPAFTHGMGDLDYGLRARNAGFKVWVMPGFAGFCEKNSPRGTICDGSLKLRQRWSIMLSAKGLPPEEWGIFCRRYTGVMWPLFFIWPYLRVVFRGLLMFLGKPGDDRG
jgi:GT2 family glycosyltransferase